ncbi:DUF2254 family protein [Methanosarcina sp. WWM596]|uniref:DUF2254 family protein n=1 Tax=Methanosarcina sp. WWM596 TaxID=1434103 RepID=UPI000615C624|nr:DUF2254 family protein [Methanosarcina sp. WWM596]AKB19979.1 hypothetical protein MSWHS_3116 [Methanosarcina sp. WWM596]
MIQLLKKTLFYIQQTKKQWVSCFILNSFLFYLIYVRPFKSINIHQESALSLLSTLAQSEAAILAIVISLSLVVIQHSASSYSARVVDIFKNDLIIWEFLVLYGLSIFYSLFLIGLINKTNDSDLGQYYSTAYVLSVIAYLSLFYYIYYVFKMIRPSSVIDSLDKNINIQSLSESWYPLDESYMEISEDEPKIVRINVRLNNEIDPLLPIIEIIRASIEKYDYATARYGLEAVTYSFLNILIRNPIEEKRISEHIFNRILEIWKLALRKKDIKFIDMVLLQYCYIGDKCTYPVGGSSLINSLLRHVSKTLFSSYNTLSIPYFEQKAVQKNLLYTTFLSEYYLKEAFKSIIEIKEDDFTKLSINLIKSIHGIGLSTFRYRGNLRMDEQIVILESLECSTSGLSDVLGEIGFAALNSDSKDSKDAVNEVISTLKDIGEASVNNNLIHSISHILEALRIVGEESAKKGKEFESSTESVIEHIESIAFQIDTQSKEKNGVKQNQLIEYYKHITTHYTKKTYYIGKTNNSREEFKEEIKRETDLIFLHIFDHIYRVSKESVKSNCFDIAKKGIKSLERIQKIFENDTRYSFHICSYIKYIGSEAVEDKQKLLVENASSLVEESIRSLYTIGILQFGYLFDLEESESEIIDFLNKEYNAALSNKSCVHSLNYNNIMWVEDNTHSIELKVVSKNEDNEIEKIHDGKEKTLIVDGIENKDIKVFCLRDIEEGDLNSFHPGSLKAFKNRIIPNSDYYIIPETLENIRDLISKYQKNSQTCVSVHPIYMAIKCFENFGIISIHRREKGPLFKIIRSLISMEELESERLKNLENDKGQDAEDDFYWAETLISDSLYHILIESLKYKLIELYILRESVDCLIKIDKEHPDLLGMTADRFQNLLEMIKESKLGGSAYDDIIALITENGIKPLKKEKTKPIIKAVRHISKRGTVRRMREESSR